MKSIIFYIVTLKKYIFKYYELISYIISMPILAKNGGKFWPIFTWGSAEQFGRAVSQFGRAGSVRPSNVFGCSVVHYFT